jgi:hypothetical protein
MLLLRHDHGFQEGKWPVSYLDESENVAAQY